MIKIKINVIIIFGLLLMFFLCAHASADNQLIGMKLLTSKIGWVATENNLYWTTDAGNTWHIITPPSASFGNIAAVFFLDTSQGWVLCCDSRGKHNEFNVAYTNNSGATWSIKPIQMPAAIAAKQKERDVKIKNQDPNNALYYDFFQGGNGWINFIDPIHGWVLLEAELNSRVGLNMGVLFKTEDGGKTWKLVNDKLEKAGRFLFMTTKEGWMVARYGDDLFATQNGGNTWQQVTLPPPPQVSSPGAQYDLPIFKDSLNGFLPVTFVTENLPSLVLFATHDGGKTWKPNGVLSEMPDIANVYPSTTVDSVLITLTSSDTERSLTLIKVLPDGKTVATKAYALDMKGDIRSLSLSKWMKLSFITDNQGWISPYDQLLSTNDGGKTWTVITPQ